MNVIRFKENTGAINTSIDTMDTLYTVPAGKIAKVVFNNILNPLIDNNINTAPSALEIYAHSTNNSYGEEAIARLKFGDTGWDFNVQANKSSASLIAEIEKMKDNPIYLLESETITLQKKVRSSGSPGNNYIHIKYGFTIYEEEI